MIQKLYLISGLPNSGTSALAGSLYYCGLSMDYAEPGLEILKSDAPGVKKAGSPYTLFEIPQIMEVNEKLLRGLSDWRAFGTLANRNCGSMMNPPPPESIKLDAATASYISHVASSAPAFPFGIKDPRFTYLFELWKDHIERVSDIQVEAIFSVRQPFAGADAIVRRGWLPNLTAALDLWLRYNLQVFRLSEKYPSRILVYEDEKSFTAQMKELVRQLGLRWSEGDVAAHLHFNKAKDFTAPEYENHPCRNALDDLYSRLKHKSILSQSL